MGLKVQRCVDACYILRCLNACSCDGQGARHRTATVCRCVGTERGARHAVLAPRAPTPFGAVVTVAVVTVAVVTFTSAVLASRAPTPFWAVVYRDLSYRDRSYIHQRCVGIESAGSLWRLTAKYISLPSPSSLPVMSNRCQNRCRIDVE